METSLELMKRLSKMPLKMTNARRLGVPSLCVVDEIRANISEVVPSHHSLSWNIGRLVDGNRLLTCRTFINVTDSTIKLNAQSYKTF